MPKNLEAEKYIAKLEKKKAYWPIKVFLNSLRLKYKEVDRNQRTYHIIVPLFGIKFRFSKHQELEDKGWDVILIDMDKLDKKPTYFEEDVLWMLVEKGYLAYVREVIGKNTFKNIVVSRGWGMKIMEKRLEMCTNPKETFMRTRNEEYIKLPIARILASEPGFFDYLI